MLKRIQGGSQLFFFVVFCLLFFSFDTFRSVTGNSGLAWFLRLNPFVTLITSVATRSFIGAYVIIGVVMILITVLLGRVFCGMICPLGGIIDFSDKLFRGRERKKQPLRPSKTLQGLKYILMIGILFMAVLGVTFPLFMDPLLLVSRLFTLLVRPAIYASVKMIPGIHTATLLTNPVVMQGAYTGSVAALVLFSIILLGAIFDRRFWCQYICPSGAFFGLLSRFSLFTRKVRIEKCSGCSICYDPRCPTRAISGEKFDSTSTAECILCGECSADKRLCSSFGFRLPAATQVTGPDINRRHVVSGLLAALIMTPVMARKSEKKRPFIPGLIRPPGAVEETTFLSRCITCDACISVCPQNALHPATLSSDGFVNWNTPKLVPRIGFCEEHCTRCSEACPTGALLPITDDDKKKTKIGTAFIHRDRCRPWRQEFRCMICSKKCPYDAIDEKIITDENGKEWPCPVVNLRKCVGCGACEYFCPVKVDAAIRVYAFNEKRKPHAPAHQTKQHEE